MKYFFTIALFFVLTSAFAQSDSISLKQAMVSLDQALVNRDEKVLTRLLNSEVTYGHSNGWVQTKSDVINDFKSGKLEYDKIDNLSTVVVAINNSWATTRENVNAAGKVNGNPFEFKLHILEVWLKTKSGWELIARQSTKMQ